MDTLSGYQVFVIFCASGYKCFYTFSATIFIWITVLCPLFGLLFLWIIIFMDTISRGKCIYFIYLFIITIIRDVELYDFGGMMWNYYIELSWSYFIRGTIHTNKYLYVYKRMHYAFYLISRWRRGGKMIIVFLINDCIIFKL